MTRTSMSEGIGTAFRDTPTISSPAQLPTTTDELYAWINRQLGVNLASDIDEIDARDDVEHAHFEIWSQPGIPKGEQGLCEQIASRFRDWLADHPFLERRIL